MFGRKEMKCHKYTNRKEIPVPKYKAGQKLWMFSHLGGYDVCYTIIRKVSEIRWVDYSDNPYWGDVPHWEITYRHQPEFRERMVQSTVNEEDLYETEANAVKARFAEFAQDTRRILGQFGKRFNQLGITDKTMTMLLENKQE